MWMVIGVFIGLLGLPSVSEAAIYLNCGASEPAINASANTLWCDDFEDGDFIYDHQSDVNANPADDGWLDAAFGFAPSGSVPDPGGHAFGRCRTAQGVAIVTGLANTGAVGTNCAADSGFVNEEGQVPSQSDHGFNGFVTAGQHLYVRHYRKCVNPSGCTYTTNTKIGTFNRAVIWGGIDFGGIGGGGESCTGSSSAGQFLCRYSKVFFTNNAGGSITLDQNQGVDDGSCAAGHTCREDGLLVGHWFYFEHHIKLNTAGSANGEYDFWMDDCGTTGTTGGCTTGGTLRSHYTGLTYLNGSGQTPTGATQIGDFWNEIYASDNTAVDFKNVGQWYWDQMVASRVRVGPMGGSGPDITPPAPPTGVHISSVEIIP
jgi:hypothetical protein